MGLALLQNVHFTTRRLWVHTDLRRVPHAVFCDGGTQWVVLSATIAKKRMGTRMCVPEDVFCMLRRPSAASPTVSVGGLRTPWNVTESARSRTGVVNPIGLSNCQGTGMYTAVPSPPLSMGWPTVAVQYR